MGEGGGAQYLFSTPDADVINFMKRLTFMEMEDVERYESSMAQPGYVPNTAQKRLAQEVSWGMGNGTLVVASSRAFSHMGRPVST